MPIASWPPDVTTRLYLDKSEVIIPSDTRGAQLPAKTIVSQMEQADVRIRSSLLEGTQLFVDLPAAFFQAYVEVQTSSSPITTFPTMCKNKNVSVYQCIKDHSSFSQKTGSLHISKWAELGWASQHDYKTWLQSSMLFAFVHCMHYCSTIRVFDAISQRNEFVIFKEVEHESLETAASKPYPKTNILSVNGFEFRNYSLPDIPQETIEQVRMHSIITAHQILSAAAITNTTDIVLIPFGMGVFIRGHKQAELIKRNIIAGLVAEFNVYDGPEITIHSCGFPFAVFEKINNPKIIFVDRKGQDAYTIANIIQDHGDNGRLDIRTNRQVKAMLINAADNDWTALLNKHRKPGQCSDGHHLFNETSDEYFALVSNFAFYSIQNIKRTLGQAFTKCISQLSRRGVRGTHTQDSEVQSTCKQRIATKIDALIKQLKSEVESCLPYPNKSRKKIKINYLESLLSILKKETYSKTELNTVLDSISTHNPIRLGYFSHRTDDLLKEIRALDETDIILEELEKTAYIPRTSSGM